jgi:hypothetical protein
MMPRLGPIVLLLGIVACGDDAESGSARAGSGASAAGRGGGPAGGRDAGQSDADNPDAGRIREVGVCGQRSEGTVTTELVGHNVLIDDLYALNGGPS